MHPFQIFNFYGAPQSGKTTVLNFIAQFLDLDTVQDDVKSIDELEKSTVAFASEEKIVGDNIINIHISRD